MATEGLMSLREAAEYLGLTRMQVYRHVNAGHIQTHTIGSMQVVEKAELDRFRAMPKNKGGRPKELVRTPGPVALAV